MAIEDFGEHIGGAKKEQWSKRGLIVADIEDMNDGERSKFIKKDNIWKKPDYEELVASGVPVRVVYFMKQIRDSVPTAPALYRTDEPEEAALKQENYINFVGQLRDKVLSLKTEEDAMGLYSGFFSDYVVKPPNKYYVEIAPEGRGVIDNKLLGAAQISSFYPIDRAIALKQFCYTEEEKALAPYKFYQFVPETCTFKEDRGRPVLELQFPSHKSFFYPSGDNAVVENWKENTWFAISVSGLIVAKNFDTLENLKAQLVKNYLTLQDSGKEKETERKKKFIPAQLSSISFGGRDYRHDENITEDDYLKTFKFKGGEFGNWLNEIDRQASLNFGYEAFCSLAEALNIQTEDISLKNSLSIAFGARGSGNALAHYEPMREVINLTKMRGAGSLGHEWGHAMDDILNKINSGHSLDNRRYNDVTKVQNELLSLMKIKYVKVPVVEQQREKDNALELDNIRLKNCCISILPNDDDLTGEQRNQKAALLETLKTDETIRYGNYIKIRGYESGKSLSISAISDFCKKITGKKLTLDSCKYLNDVVSKYNIDKKIEVDDDKLVPESTDFYINSKKFDSIYSKENKGYWSSGVEMFARAFACYVEDKCTAAGITCDYLNGHADLSNAFENDKVISAYPQGEERKLLNEQFDKLILKFKELGLLHENNRVRETCKEPKNYIQKESGQLKFSDFER